MTDQTPSNPDPEKGDGGKKSRKRKPLPEDGFDWRKGSRTLVLWILLVLVSWILFRQLNFNEKPEAHKSYTQYRKLLESGQVDGADVIEREFHGRLKDGTGILTTLPFIDDQMLAEWDSLKIDYQFKDKTTNWLGIFISTVLPWIIFIAIWLYLMRRMQGGGTRGVFSFGKSRAKLSMEGKPKITFDDVAGCDEAKEELQEVIAFLRDPKKFSRLGGRIPKGALLLGPPGTGKTLLARAVAGEAEVPFFSMSGADFVEMFVGVGAARVRDLFETGKKHAPCIIFIDEIDAVGRHRGAGLGGGHDEREQTLNQLLVEMDGFEGNDGVILIAATNRPDVLDPALTRPGRFDRQIVVDRPDVRGREGILRVHTRHIPLSSDVRMDVLAKGTPGLAGADLANLVNEAALLAARHDATQVTMSDFEEAKDKVMMGTERKSMLISEDEKKQTAYHEAGHVLVAKMTPGADPVHKVTIIPRGRALGLTHYLPLDEKHNYSRNYLKQTLIHLMGGRVAEKIIFNEFSTGAGNDIERATDIARRMVCEWGMSERMGAIAFGKRQEEIFLGREISQHRDFSERTAQDIDIEVRRIVTDAEKSAEKILREHLDKLRMLAEGLLEREILDGDEIDILIRGGKLPPQIKPTEIAQPVPAGRRDHSRGGRRDQRGDGRFQPGRRNDGRPDQPRDNRRNEAPRPPQREAQRSEPTPDVSRDAPRSTPPVEPPRTQPVTQNRDSGRGRAPEAPRSNPPTEPPRSQPTDQHREGGRGRPPEAGRSSGRMRRDFARSYGVVSSRDPENQRPTPMEISRMRAAQLAKEGKSEPGTETKPEVKAEPKVEPRVEQKIEPRVEPRNQPRFESRPEPKPEIRPEPRSDFSTQQRPEPKLLPRREPPLELRVDPRPEPRFEPRNEPRPEGRFEPRSEPQSEPKPVTKPEELTLLPADQTPEVRQEQRPPRREPRFQRNRRTRPAPKVETPPIEGTPSNWTSFDSINLTPTPPPESTGSPEVKSESAPQQSRQPRVRSYRSRPRPRRENQEPQTPTTSEAPPPPPPASEPRRDDSRQGEDG